MNDQLNVWSSDFGLEYSKRNQYFNEIDTNRYLVRNWARMLSKALPTFPNSALEVGCNLGANLVALKPMIKELNGLEPNKQVLENAKKDSRLEGVNLVNGNGFEIPFKDNSVELVFTNGVLIHIHPDNLGKVVDEIYRVSSKYIICSEYFAAEPEAITYRGMENQLFKRDFGSFYLDRFPTLKVVDYGFFWNRVDGAGNLTWWLLQK